MAEGTIVNPTQAFWVDLAANSSLLSVVDILVPHGQIAIGLALIVGVATRFSGMMGFLMMAFITIAAWDFAHGVVNTTSFLAIASLLLGVIRAGEVCGIEGAHRQAANRPADACAAVCPRLRSATTSSPVAGRR